MRAETRAPPDPGRAALPCAPVATSPPWPFRLFGSPGCEVALRPSPPSVPQYSEPSLAVRSWATLPPRAPEGQSNERNVQLSSHWGHCVPVRRGLRQWLHQHFGVSEPRAKKGASGRDTRCLSPDAQISASRWRVWAPQSPEARRLWPPSLRERKCSVCSGSSWGLWGVPGSIWAREARHFWHTPFLHAWLRGLDFCKWSQGSAGGRGPS